jgi:hypothetical protein
LCSNERDIVKWAMKMSKSKESPNHPRVSTFGIGTYCNHYFLKMLAFVGRGFYDRAMTAGDNACSLAASAAFCAFCGVVVPHTCHRATHPELDAMYFHYRSSHTPLSCVRCAHAEGIATAMQKLFTSMAKPVLTSIEMVISDVEDVEMYPFPCPDLFCGRPCMVSGKFAGVFPSHITIQGQLPNGQMHQQPVYTTNAANIPLDKVYVKQRLDMMTAKAWLEENEQLKQAAIALSMREGVICAHTKMVTFETTPEKYSQLKQEQLKGQSPSSMSKALTVVRFRRARRLPSRVEEFRRQCAVTPDIAAECAYSFYTPAAIKLSRAHQ